LPLGSVASMIVVTVAHRSIKIVNKLLRLRIVGFVTLLSSDRITNCYQVPSRHHVKVRVLPAFNLNERRYYLRTTLNT